MESESDASCDLSTHLFAVDWLFRLDGPGGHLRTSRHGTVREAVLAAEKPDQDAHRTAVAHSTDRFSWQVRAEDLRGRDSRWQLWSNAPARHRAQLFARTVFSRLLS